MTIPKLQSVVKKQLETQKTTRKEVSEWNVEIHVLSTVCVIFQIVNMYTVLCHRRE